MVAPDVQIEDGKGTILISSEEGETEGKGGGLLWTSSTRTWTRSSCSKKKKQQFELSTTSSLVAESVPAAS